MRSLSNDEYEEAENIRAKILLSAPPFVKIIEASLLENLPQIDASPEMNKIYSQYFNFLKNMKMSMKMNTRMMNTRTKNTRTKNTRMKNICLEMNFIGQNLATNCLIRVA